MGTKEVKTKVYSVRLSTGDKKIVDRIVDILAIDQGLAYVIRLALRHLLVDLVSTPYPEDRVLVEKIMGGLE